MLVTGHGIHNRRAPDFGYPRPVASEGEEPRGASADVQAVHRPVRGPSQQIHLPHGLTGTYNVLCKICLLDSISSSAYADQIA